MTKKNPFLVITDQANINVTGTSFNVKAHKNSKQFETVLAEGVVELHVKRRRNKQVVTMKPGERAIYSESNKNIVLQEVDAEIYTAWRNGEMLFKDATLNDLIKELERIYDIQFVIHDKNVGDYRFRGMFSYDNNLIDALEKIAKTASVNYQIENRKVELFKK